MLELSFPLQSSIQTKGAGDTELSSTKKTHYEQDLLLGALGDLAAVRITNTTLRAESILPLKS